MINAKKNGAGFIFFLVLMEVEENKSGTITPAFPFHCRNFLLFLRMMIDRGNWLSVATDRASPHALGFSVTV